MKICVCGWYFIQEFYNELKKSKYNITIVSNNAEVPESIKNSFDNIIINENIGLEFGAYNRFIMSSTIDDNILFLHDDTLVSTSSLEEIERICENIDQAYIFRDYEQQKNNGGKHGRCMYMSSKFIEFLKKEYSGIPYDKLNMGYNGTTKNTSNLDYNKGINDYHRLLGKIRDRKLGFEILYRLHIKEIKLGRRGKIK